VLVIEEIRRNNLIKIFHESGCLRAMAFAKKIDVAPAMISMYINGKGDNKKNIGSIIARRIEKKMGLETGWMDHSHANERSHENNIVAQPTGGRFKQRNLRARLRSLPSFNES